MVQTRDSQVTSQSLFLNDTGKLYNKPVNGTWRVFISDVNGNYPVDITSVQLFVRAFE